LKDQQITKTIQNGHYFLRNLLYAQTFYTAVAQWLTFWGRNYFFLILAHPVYKK